jgi:hypothetical protein
MTGMNLGDRLRRYRSPLMSGTGWTGRWPAVVAAACAPVSAGTFLYVEFGPHRFGLDNIWPAVLWVVGIVVGLIGLAMSLVALVLSKFQRLSPWLVISVHVLIVLYGIVRPVVVFVVGIQQMEGKGWH